MNRKTITLLILLGVTAFVLAILYPPEREIAQHVLPWQIERTDGSTRVFGLVLGESTLGQAANRFGEEPQVNLFVSPDGRKNVEAYYNTLLLGGLSAKVVLNLDVPAQRLEAMYERGRRISTLGSGTRKVDLHTDDQVWLRGATIAAITYIPSVQLDAARVQGRFGEPAMRIAEPQGGTEHWLYPSLGLDVALDPKEREVLQYVPPDRFDEVMRPLRERGRPLS